MRSLLAVCLLALPAFGHIKLTSPGNFQVTDLYGGPNKDEPCGGNGVPTGVVTEVIAGSQLTVSWTEPIPHPGYFRIGIARSDADFRTPTAVVMNNDCKSAPKESPVAYPTLVDGLFQHSSAMGPYTTTVTVPMMSCANCKLQVMQFMSSHAPPCFYYQCAVLRIVMPVDAGQPVVDAGVVDAGVMSDAGAGGGAGGGGAAAGGGSGGGSAGGTATGGGTSSGTCGPASCAGCCVLGRCEAGAEDSACGVGGAICATCSASDACESGLCKPVAPGCGCTSAPVGVMAMLLGLMLARRRRAGSR
jgi:hypothetical protein